MKKRIAFFALTLSLAALNLAANGADDIVKKVIQAAGGAERLKGVQSRRFVGEGSFNGGAVSGTLEFYAKRPNLLLLKFDFNGTVASQGYDGKKAWQLQPAAFGGSGVAEDAVGDTADAILQSADFDTPLLDYKARGNGVELIGKEEVGDRQAYRLRVSPKTTKGFDILVDDETFLVIKRIAKRSVPQLGEVEVELSLEDYRDIDGIMIPHRYVTMVGGKALNEFEFSTVELNAKLDDELFRRPGR